MKRAIYWCNVDQFPDTIQKEKMMDQLPVFLQKNIKEYKNERDFARSLIGKSLLRKGLEKLGKSHLMLEIERNNFGRYVCPKGEVDFNISHSGNAVVVAFETEGKVGIDIQEKSKGSLLIAERFFAEEEVEWMKKQKDFNHAFTHVWTRKEAVVKATGTGIRIALNSFLVLNDELEMQGEPFYLQSDLTHSSDYFLTVCSNLNLPYEIQQISLVELL
ncbi:MAG: 4'-phosphopantetheinyl transferase superfamily protein [Bacteroidetes bacterium]|nr:4'-phosphopantetheinyl transferase superfamily protein [Bacteroidota bacterium]